MRNYPSLSRASGRSRTSTSFVRVARVTVASRTRTRTRVRVNALVWSRRAYLQNRNSSSNGPASVLRCRGLTSRQAGCGRRSRYYIA